MFTPGKKNGRKKPLKQNDGLSKFSSSPFLRGSHFQVLVCWGASLGSLMHVWTGRKIYHHSIPSSLFRWLQDRFGKVIHEFWVFGNFLLSLFLFPKYIHNSNLTQGTCKCGYFRMSCNSYYIFRRYLHTIEASMDLLNLRQIPTWNQKQTSPKRMLG